MRMVTDLAVPDSPTKRHGLPALTTVLSSQVDLQGEEEQGRMGERKGEEKEGRRGRPRGSSRSYSRRIA